MVQKKPGAAFFPLFFVGIGVVFIGILAFAYYGTRQANPVMLDEKGQIKGSGQR